MDKEKHKAVTASTSITKISAKYQQKDWVKKLEAASGKPIDLPKKTSHVYLLLDCSGSMGDSKKMEQAKKGGVTFSDEAIKKGYIIGLITFASSAELLFEGQNNLSHIREYIMQPIASGSTNLTEAIRIAKEKLTEQFGEKIMCIITDGMPDDEHSALEIAGEAHRAGIDIMTIGTDDADREFLRKLSTRDELAIKVSRNQFEQGIVSMAKMLPAKL